MTEPASNVPSKPTSTYVWRKRIMLILVALFFSYIFFTEVLDPWGDKPYMEVPHGDHTHYLPHGVDLDEVNVSAFPTSPPGPNEEITPDGRIVPKQ